MSRPTGQSLSTWRPDPVLDSHGGHARFLRAFLDETSSPVPSQSFPSPDRCGWDRGRGEGQIAPGFSRWNNVSRPVTRPAWSTISVVNYLVKVGDHTTPSGDDIPLTTLRPDSTRLRVLRGPRIAAVVAQAARTPRRSRPEPLSPFSHKTEIHPRSVSQEFWMATVDGGYGAQGLVSRAEVGAGDTMLDTGQRITRSVRGTDRGPCDCGHRSVDVRASEDASALCGASSPENAACGGTGRAIAATVGPRRSGGP